MALAFNETNQWVAIADDPSLNLGASGDWCVGGWTNVSDNTGSLFQYFLSNNNFQVAHSFNLFLIETSEGTSPDAWRCAITDSGSRNYTLDSSDTTNSPGGDGKDRLIIIQRVSGSSELQMWFCEAGASAVKVSNVADTSWNGVNGGAWNIGRRVDGNADRYYGGEGSEVFLCDFSLTSEEITALGNGVRIKDLGRVLELNMPLDGIESTEPDLSGNGNNGTVNGATKANHPPIKLWTPQRSFIEEVVVGITGTSTTTNAADTQSASGTLENAGTSTTTNAADTQAATGVVGVSGSSATTNAPDTQSAVGELTNSGTSATTNAADTQSASGIVGTAIVGTSITTNAPDTQAASGELSVIGSSTPFNAPDTQSANGELTNSGSSATTNAADTQAAAGIVGFEVIGPGRTFKAVVPLRIIKAAMPLRTFKATIPQRVFKAAA